MNSVKRRSFGVIPVSPADNGETFFLILRSFKNWDFPKGGADGEETPLEAALREMKEETGIQTVTMPWGTMAMDTEIYARDKVVSYFLARVEKQEITLPVSAELGHPEHDEYRWVTAEEARLLLPARLLPILQWAIKTTSSSPVSI